MVPQGDTWRRSRRREAGWKYKRAASGPSVLWGPVGDAHRRADCSRGETILAQDGTTCLRANSSFQPPPAKRKGIENLAGKRSYCCSNPDFSTLGNVSLKMLRQRWHALPMRAPVLHPCCCARSNAQRCLPGSRWIGGIGTLRAGLRDIGERRKKKEEKRRSAAD